MPVTRRSRATAASTPSPKSAPKTKGKRGAGTKSSPLAKRIKTNNDKKEQKTIEETMPDVNLEEDANDSATQVDDREIKNGNFDAQNDKAKTTNGEKKGSLDDKTNGEPGGLKEGVKNAFDEVKADESELKEAAKEEEVEKSEKVTSNKGSVVEDPKREVAMPSSILEKGIIYFFFRGRVNIDQPQSVDDIARSYMVLRPLPLGAKLGEGPLEDVGNTRLLALPKKVLPKSKQDRFLVFVEKVNISIKDLKENFVSGYDYATKTSGTSHTPAATPIAEGIYAITSTGRESHLVYHITIPEPLGEIQKDIGLNEKGSYVVSAKNPTVSAPGNASLPKSAEYPEKIMQKFRSLRWMPLEPELLDYENTQFLVIGEGMGNIEKATEEQEKDKKDDEKAAPAEEMEKLEDEDQIRVQHLKGDDPIFADLGLSSKQYPKLQTTW